MEYKTIQLDFQDGICLLTMNNPKTLNAMSDVTIAELSSALDEIEQDNSIRVVIVTGNGKAFIAGADIGYMKNLDSEQAREYAKSTTDVYDKIRDSKKVFIAAINGYAFGGGCEFALACDLCIASENARFSQPEVSLGILPGGGGTQRLARLVGVQKAMELILTGSVIRADEALRIGLVCAVVPAEDLMDRAYEMANRILKNAPLAVKYARECIRQSEMLTLNAGIEYENAMFGLCFASPDQGEGMAAFLEKRAANFQTGF